MKQHPVLDEGNVEYIIGLDNLSFIYYGFQINNSIQKSSFKQLDHLAKSFTKL